MVFKRYTLLTAAAALAGVASAADLAVISPGGPNLWWVQNSQNTLLWTCQQTTYQNFTILIANSNPSILVAPSALIAIEYDYDCSKTITESQSNWTPSTGYTIQLANPLNQTDIYAQSQEFEIKAAGSAYPAASATPTSSASATGSGATGSASGSASSPTSSSAAGVGKKASVVLGGLAVLAAALGIM
ncbi:hypothetical protein OE88DRAFT_1665663 [Heliocybe sulcata]|uniref:Uncharacterized protein n=1 Tax=Heliocybe sulcata TaxID=5364 RepID=A0A5C3MRL5_9AGAM|nr:hypothetical protein OE88DRAFT_1665663 [Heliocybe sulcata]